MSDTSDMPLALTLQEALANRLRQLARTCLHLRLEPGEHANTAPESGFGGRPWWLAGEDWPVCDACGQPLGFICQMRLDGGGHWRPDHYDLLSFFSCRQCSQNDGSGTDERPSGDRCRMRLFHLTDQPLAPLDLPGPLLTQAEQLSCRVTGAPALDTPGWQDAVEEFAVIAPHALDALQANYLLAEREVLREHAQHLQSQLGGYPHWVSESAWPECRWCGGQMYLLAQIVPDEHTGLLWGSGRIAYLFCCAEPCDQEALTLVLQG